MNTPFLILGTNKKLIKEIDRHPITSYYVFTGFKMTGVLGLSRVDSLIEQKT